MSDEQKKPGLLKTVGGVLKISFKAEESQSMRHASIGKLAYASLGASLAGALVYFRKKKQLKLYEEMYEELDRDYQHLKQITAQDAYAQTGS